MFAHDLYNWRVRSGKETDAGDADTKLKLRLYEADYLCIQGLVQV